MTPPKRRRRFPKAAAPPPPLPPRPKDGEGKGPKKIERLYVISGEDGARADLDLVTLIVACADPPLSATPEQTALLRLCTAPLSVAELSAYLSLPYSVMTVLLTEMLAADLVQARAPIARQSIADRNLLEAVMHGLQKL